MSFINPYNFVRVPRSARRGYTSIGLERFQGWTGVLACRLHVLTPVVVVGGRSSDGMSQLTNDAGEPVIPGTALRGMVRSVFETVTHSCGAGIDDPCQQPDNCCHGCRIFGFVANEAHQMGAVCFSDAKGDSNFVHAVNRYIPREGNPKPAHKFFYRINGESRGRKFYYHHEPRIEEWPETPESGYRSRIRSWVGHDATLDFQVHFSGLDDPDLVRLLYAIALEPQLGHKIGHGRPLGLGSCSIEMLGEKTVMSNRYGMSGEPFINFKHKGYPLKEKSIENYVECARIGVEADISLRETLTDLRSLLRLPSHHPPHFHTLPIQYPDYSWFDRERKETEKKPLPTALDVDRNRNMLE
jgi:hypothetical protein